MYVIYHITSTMQVGPYHGHPHTCAAKLYKTAGAARNTCNNWNDKAISDDPRSIRGMGPGPYGWCHVDHYRNRVVRMVTRTNMMSGEQYQEASNTPGYMSPSFEAYWSM